jgi:TolA-binding protein
MWASDGDELRQQGEARDRRLTQLEEQSVKTRQEIEQKLKELQDVLDRATEVLKRGSADVGAQVSQMSEQLNRLDGTVAEIQHKLGVVEQQVATQRTDLDTQLSKLKGGAGAIDPSDIPTDKTSHFQAAYTAYTGGDHEKARALFREYVSRYRDDTKAGEAQYWIGASYTTQNKPATALGEYRKVISEFSKSTAVNVALYGMGDAFYRLHACTDAKSALDALIKRKPEASLADRAKRLLKQVQTAGKAYCSS